MPDYQQHERFGVHYLRPTSERGCLLVVRDKQVRVFGRR